MKNFLKTILVSFLFIAAISSCTDNDDNPSSLPTQNFVWEGLNTYYLWQADVPNLADNKFSTQSDLDGFLDNYNSPESLFSDLLYQKGTVDRFSVIFSDYVKLEQALTGTAKSNGLEIELRYKNTTSNEVFGFIRYVMPNSDASSKPIQRGTFFYAINGIAMTQDRTTRQNNFSNILNSDTYTLNLADYDNGNITPNGQSVSLTKTAYSENPVLIRNVSTVGAKKIGYLMYNGFYSAYETQLNDAFGFLKNEGITDLVLDLRYNGGGSIATATRLGSMITGLPSSQVFSKQQWNSKVQAALDPSNFVNNFATKIDGGANINSLNLSKLYVLTTGSTASASELVINSLKAYINVVQIGTKTVGKNVGSITLYDTKNFTRPSNGVTANSNYAMQPLVLKTTDKNGFGEYQDGILPDSSNELREDLANLGVLGNVSEPLFAKAISLITGIPRASNRVNVKVFESVKDDSFRDLKTEMYLDEYPEGLGKILK
jgi:carboxyl-terminal processing protease